MFSNDYTDLEFWSRGEYHYFLYGDGGTGQNPYMYTRQFAPSFLYLQFCMSLIIIS